MLSKLRVSSPKYNKAITFVNVDWDTFKDKPVKERFGLCPWGLYHIEVKKA